MREIFSSDLNLSDVVIGTLDTNKADDIVTIDLSGKSDLADLMVIASGQSSRHVFALAEHIIKKFKELGINDIQTEGMFNSNWVVVDIGNIIIHLFIKEVRDFYNLEKMWNNIGINHLEEV